MVSRRPAGAGGQDERARCRDVRRTGRNQRAARHEKGLRAVVLSGEGRAFCAGLDMGRFAAMKEKGGNGVAVAKAVI